MASDVKKLMNQLAEDQMGGMPAARAAYKQAKQDSKNVINYVNRPGRTENLRAMIGGDNFDTSKFMELKDMAKRAMSPDEYAKFLSEAGDLNAIMQYHKNVATDLPVGTMKAFGAMGAVGLKGAPSQAVVDTGSTLLRLGQNTAKAVRPGLGVLAPQVLQQLEDQNPYGGMTTDTLDPEEQQKQKQLLQVIQGLGGK